MRKIGVYVDASNIAMNGGYGMRYDVLREFACRAGGEAQRLNAYIAFDEERAGSDRDYAHRTLAFHSVLRSHGFRLSVKKTKRYTDEDGVVHLKANTDLDMAVDVLTESDKLDTVLLVTGDGDFTRVVTALQSKGCRVEVLAFDNISRELREQADTFINGYVLPGLLPVRNPPDAGTGRNNLPWGAIGSRVRGYCTHYDTLGGYGFISFYRELPGTTILSASASTSAYMRKAELGDLALAGRLPSWHICLEFELAEPSRPAGFDGHRYPEARRIEVMGSL